MVKPSCTIKAENCEEAEVPFGGQLTTERKRILKLVSNFKLDSNITKPEHKRSARLANKAAARARSPPPAPVMCESHTDLETALVSTEELLSSDESSLLDPFCQTASIDDCWFPQVNTILADIDEISAELDLDDALSCSSGGSDCTILDSLSSESLDDVLGDKPKKRKPVKRAPIKREPAPTTFYTVPPPVPQSAYSAALPAPGPMRLSFQKAAAETKQRMKLPYTYTGVTLSIGGKKSAAYTRKPLAVHGGQRIRAHLGFAANLAAVAAEM